MDYKLVALENFSFYEPIQKPGPDQYLKALVPVPLRGPLSDAINFDEYCLT